MAWCIVKAQGKQDQRKQTKLQWMHNPSRTSRNNLNNVRRETSRYFKNKEMEYVKEKLMNFKERVRTEILDTCIEA